MHVIIVFIFHRFYNNFNINIMIDLVAAFFRGYALSLYRFAGRYGRAELGKALPRPYRRRHRHRDGIRPRTDGTAKEERERPKTVFDALTQTAVNYFTYSREICQHRHVFRINGVVGYLYCIKRKRRLKVNWIVIIIIYVESKMSFKNRIYNLTPLCRLVVCYDNILWTVVRIGNIIQL